MYSNFKERAIGTIPLLLSSGDGMQAMPYQIDARIF